MLRRVLVSLAISGAVFATGAAALIYQVAFERYLARLVGSDHVATGLTLATFLGGLALGYWLCGRLTLSVRDHLLGYAVLEALIGLWAVGFPWLFARVESAVSSWSFSYPWGLALQGLFVAGVLVLPPTLLMGATVPFITRALSRLREQVSSIHAATYSINTAGAFVGVLLGGFYLVPAYGLPAVVRGTALVNVAAAVLFAGLGTAARWWPAPSAIAGAFSRPVIERPRFSRTVLYTMGILSGLAVLLLEAVTIRLGKLVFGSSTYTFSMIVAVFVLAIAVGSLAVARSPRLPAGLLFALQMIAGVYLLLLFTTLDEWPYWAHMLRIGFQPGPSGFFLYYAGALCALFAVLVVPVAALGATLPVLFHELDASVRLSGWHSGRLLALNGVGTLIGSLCGSFVLYAFLDLPRIFLVVPVIVFVNALLASGVVRPGARAASLLLLAVSVAAVVTSPGYHADRLAFGLFLEREPLPFSGQGAPLFYEEYFRGSTLVARRDDPVASVAVLERTRETAAGPTTSMSIVLNGRSDSDTLIDEETLKLAAHIPALWAPSRERVLVVGLGTGVTAGELSLYEDAGRIDVAEISPSVIDFLPLFSEHTSAVHEDSRLHVQLGDAVLALRRASEPWDVITSEPSNPWVAGADTLFTREFYRLVRERLSERGVFLQWVQLYDNDYEMLGVMLNTLKSEFPVLHAFRGSEGDLLLLASSSAFTAEDGQRARETLAANPRAAASLAEIGILSTADLLAREVQTLPLVLRQAERRGINTMDHPRLLYMAGRAMFAGTRVTEQMLSHGSTNLDFLFDERFRSEHGAGR